MHAHRLRTCLHDPAKNYEQALAKEQVKEKELGKHSQYMHHKEVI